MIVINYEVANIMPSLAYGNAPGAIPVPGGVGRVRAAAKHGLPIFEEPMGCHAVRRDSDGCHLTSKAPARLTRPPKQTTAHDQPFSPAIAPAKPLRLLPVQFMVPAYHEPAIKPASRQIVMMSHGHTVASLDHDRSRKEPTINS